MTRLDDERRRTMAVDALRRTLEQGAERRTIEAVRAGDLALPSARTASFRTEVAELGDKVELFSHLSKLLVSVLRSSQSNRTGSIRRMLPALHRTMLRSRRGENADALVRRLRRFRDDAPSPVAMAQADLLLTECAGHRRGAR